MTEADLFKPAAVSAETRVRFVTPGIALRRLHEVLDHDVVIVDVPGGPLEPSTVLPVQIYLWADSPERAFVERTSAAIMVLLGFLIFMNAVAVLLRKRFERRW